MAVAHCRRCWLLSAKHYSATGTDDSVRAVFRSERDQSFGMHARTCMPGTIYGFGRCKAVLGRGAETPALHKRVTLARRGDCSDYFGNDFIFRR
ncbi:hypothetical protein EVAR_5507_1 [Eumeta japonica]|uniref:Uncharacterized protein n=1 Tax=Eumeta variegata TaxID=151549 RepID=A0A4C1T9U6_EUMVA|nr:hypothetical protein EVAR_5507_1 [Eumeta japonica]